MEGYLKVTPEQLLKAADTFAQAGQSVAGLTSEMMSVISSLKGIWQGEAAESYMGKFSGLEDDIMRINNMITEHVNDLTEMARTYQAAEDASLEESAALLSDVVE
ncbi:MAG: WXG100 family type VII secretion target [Lachnospiraceae bacterium]|nr:WXG100 family type VII secretion target [Lachnospiraceae bacterium]